MGKKFEVGKYYECANVNMKPIIILGRTKKNISVNDGYENWSARVKVDNEGYEYIQKNETKILFKGIQTYSACWEIKE